MTKVELHPAVFAHCDFCDRDDWYLCTMYTGMDAALKIVGDLDTVKEMDRHVKMVQKKCKRDGIECPLPDIRSTILIQAKLSCKGCKRELESGDGGYNFACEDCGRDNYVLEPKAKVTCEHCGSKFKAIHFFEQK